MNDTSMTPERRKAIENIYPLSPMQEGLLFHTIANPAAGVYMPQTVLRLEGHIDAGRLETAWRDAVARHAVLRSSFHWEEREHPFQVVHRQADLSWTRFDWQPYDKDEQEAQLVRLLADNRKNRFDLHRPPLLRLHWIDTGENRGMLVLAYHHLILDGWSVGQLVRESFQLYMQHCGAVDLVPPPPRPYADYIAWLRRQDHAASKRFWAGYLDGLEHPTLLFPAAEPQSFKRREWTCPPALGARLKDFCKASGLTMNTLLQGAVALLVARVTGRSDVVFGATVAGRPSTLANAAGMVGLFINTLPVRTRLDAAQTLTAWLDALQRRQAETVEHEYLPLRSVQGDWGALFDCLLIFESYPVSKDLGKEARFRLTGVDFDEWTHYPLTIFATTRNDELVLTARYNSSLPDGIDASTALDALATILERLATAPDATLDDFIAPSDPRQTGKVSIEATPLPEPRCRRAATTSTERMLATVWAEVLKGPEPQAHDHFFELGGHSLLAARVISRVRRDYDMELPVKSLFDRPVLGDLAAYIDALRATAAPSRGEREIEI